MGKQHKEPATVDIIRTADGARKTVSRKAWNTLYSARPGFELAAEEPSKPAAKSTKETAKKDD